MMICQVLLLISMIQLSTAVQFRKRKSLRSKSLDKSSHIVGEGSPCSHRFDDGSIYCLRGYIPKGQKLDEEFQRQETCDPWSQIKNIKGVTDGITMQTRGDKEPICCMRDAPNCVHYRIEQDDLPVQSGPSAYGACEGYFKYSSCDRRCKSSGHVGKRTLNFYVQKEGQPPCKDTVTFDQYKTMKSNKHGAEYEDNEHRKELGHHTSQFPVPDAPPHPCNEHLCTPDDSKYVCCKGLSGHPTEFRFVSSKDCGTPKFNLADGLREPPNPDRQKHNEICCRSFQERLGEGSWTVPGPQVAKYIDAGLDPKDRRLRDYCPI